MRAASWLLLAVSTVACGESSAQMEEDAGSEDALDAGSNVDAGEPSDAGDPHDAGPETDAGPEADAGPETDAGTFVPTDCEGAPAMQIGACHDTVSGGRCIGDPDEVGEYAAMGEGEPLNMVNGPQGATMFLMSFRVTGVDPGDPARPFSSDNPRIEIIVTDGDGAEVAHYNGLHALEPDPALPGWLFKAGLFVVVDERPSTLVGHMLTATATLVDKDGIERCGTLTFSAVF